MENGITLNLVLTEHWFDEIESGRKRIEYREMSDHWKRLIWDRRDRITHVRFQRAFNKGAKKLTFMVDAISVGKCPYDGWDECYYKIMFRE